MPWPCAAATGKFARLDRSNVKYPPTDLNKSGPTHAATCGALVRVEIERATGALRIAKAYSVLECGQALVPEVVLGQAQGGFAMGVGFALLESLPPYEGGPATANGTSVNTSSHAGRTCRCMGLRLRCCHPSMPTSGRRG